MRALSLDYSRSERRAQHWAGMIALLLAIVCLVWMGWYYRQLSEQAIHLEALVAKIEHTLHPGLRASKPSVADGQQLGAEIQDANEVMLRLGLPWGEMFAAMEQANRDDIALLGIEPDAKKGSIRLSGEAKSFAALFAYIRLLQKSSAMSAVYLRQHQIKEQDPERPVRFTLDASWNGNR